MLNNPGFEGISRPGGYTRDTHTGEVHGNWVTPEGWVGWWDESGDRQRPETEVIHLEAPYVGPPRRIRDGEWAVKVFVSFHSWLGGYYQVVDNLEIGRMYGAGFWAHAWCNNDGLPHAGEPGCAPMGCGALYRTRSQLPPLMNEPVNDAWWAALFDVGVQQLGRDDAPDPHGSVQWGQVAAIYNVYGAVPPVLFTAETGRAAVFLRCAFRWEFRNNDAYLDDAWLSLSEEPPLREYARTYVLLPPDTTRDEAHRVIDDHFDDRRTIGFSADDAGIDARGLTERNVIAYWPDGWPGDLREFFDTYYPGLDSYEEKPDSRDVLIWQRDPEWAGDPFGAEGCEATIGSAGCFITCLAMAQRFYKVRRDATPVTVDEALGPAGYNDCIATWGAQRELYAQALELAISYGSEQQAAVHMADGACAIAEVAPGSLQHFALIYEEDGRYIALDPWQPERRRFALDEAESWRLLVWVPPAASESVVTSLHVQSMKPGVEQFIRAVRPGGIKRVMGMEDLVTFKSWAPGTASIWRQHAEQHNYLERGDPDGRITASALGAARDWIAIYRDSLVNVCQMGPWTVHHPLYVEAWNELGWAASNLDSIKRAASIERAYVHELVALGLPVAPVVFCAGVGNIGRSGLEEEDFLLLLDLARETEAVGGAFGLHSYWTPGRLGQNWRYLAGRYQWIDEVLVRNGVHVKWMLGEAGVAGTFDNPLPIERGGWRCAQGHNGNWSAYLAEILECERRDREWNRTHEGRLICRTLFTVGSFGGWPTFELDTPQIESLMQALS